MGNHPDNQRVSDANQWPHHFNMLGQLLLGFIFMIVVFFLYVVRPGVSALAPFRFPTGRPRAIARAPDDRLADQPVFPSRRPTDALLAE